MTGEPTIRAIYLEDRESEFERFAPILERSLAFGRFKCNVVLVKSADEFEKALANRPHVAICDLDLGEGPLRFEGAKVIARLKPAYPDVVFFLLTGQNLKIGQVGAITPNPDHFLNKEYVGNKQYNEYIGSIVSQQLNRYPVREVETRFDLRSGVPTSGRARLTASELHSLVEQCVFGVDAGSERVEIGKVELSGVEGGFSGSGVYLMHIWTGDRKNSVPGILKISELAKAKQEIDNYNRYVKWRLPYLWRVDLMGFGATGGFGAICYSFAMGGGKEPAPANKFLREGKLDVVGAVVDSILFSRNQNWYAERRSSGQDARIYFGEGLYYQKLNKRQTREDYFRRKLAQVADAGKITLFDDDHSFVFGGTKYLGFNHCVFGRDWGEVKTCVCHGDMNGANIIFTGERNEVAFIDFQNTGFHYLFRDFVSFESSVRLEVKGEDQGWDETRFHEVLSGEERLLNAEWNKLERNESYINEITKIRQAANQNFEGEAFEQYVLATTVHSLWLLEKSEKWAAYKQRRLLASILAGLRYLGTVT